MFFIRKKNSKPQAQLYFMLLLSKYFGVDRLCAKLYNELNENLVINYIIQIAKNDL